MICWVQPEIRLLGEYFAVASRPVDCRIARPTVRYLVYWVIFVWPAWPYVLRVSSREITTVSRCRMIDAVMYGMIPSAKTESYSSATPENRLIRPRPPVVPAPETQER